MHPPDRHVCATQARFAHDKVGEASIDGDTFEVEQYLSYQADKFTNNKFDANCYLQLSKCTPSV